MVQQDKEERLGYILTTNVRYGCVDVILCNLFNIVQNYWDVFNVRSHGTAVSSSGTDAILCNRAIISDKDVPKPWFWDYRQ